MAFYVFRWYCQIPRPSANKIAADCSSSTSHFQNKKYKNIVKYTFYFLIIRQQNLILRFFITLFRIFGFFFFVLMILNNLLNLYILLLLLL